MSSLNEDLDDLAPSASVRELAEAIASRASITSDRQKQYVSIRPALEGAIAVYVLRERVSIALPPERALEVESLVPGCTLMKKTPATTYLVLEDAGVGAHFPLATDLAIEAIDWREQGPKWGVATGDGGAHGREPEFCPMHWMELSVTGACAFCE